MKKGTFVSKIYLLLLFLLPGTVCQAENIIFDLGGVLLETGYIQTIFNLGWEFAAYASTWRNPFSSHRILFNFLNDIPPENPDAIVALDAQGRPMPYLINLWLKGQITPREILALVRTHEGSFGSWAEEALVRALAQLIFTPEYFVKTRSLVHEGLAFVKECKQAGHSLYILSNWDPYSFTLLEETHPELFELFDGIVISGDIGLIKPDPAIFHFLLDFYHLDPENCFFVDDQYENICAAQKEGITAVLCKRKWSLFGSSCNFKTVKEALQQWISAKKVSAGAI